MKHSELHVHDFFSLLDGCSSPEEYMIRAKEIGITHLAQTNHGTNIGHREFYRQAKSAGIVPILGQEAYFTHDRFDRRAAANRKDGTNVFNHLTILAKNATGLKNLDELSRIAWTEGYYYKPRCLPGGSEVTTPEGVKNIEDINVGDLVLSHNGTFNKVINTSCNKYDGVLYGLNISSRYGKTLWFTDEHPILIKDNHTNQESFILAKDVQAGRRRKTDMFATWNSLVAVPRLRYVGRADTINLSTYFSDDGWTYCNGRWERATPRVTIKPTRHFIDFPETISLDYDFGFVVGLYAAEGWRDRGSCNIAINKTEEDTLGKRFIHFAENVLGKRVRKSYKDSHGGVTLSIDCVLFAQLMETLCGKYAMNKKLPTILWDSPQCFAEGCFDGVVAGDGSEYSTHFSFSSISKNLIWQVRTLGVSLGYGFSKVVGPVNSGGYKSDSLHYHLNISKGIGNKHFQVDEEKVWRPVSNVETKKFSGLVYNIEVENTHTFVSDIITHNCDFESLERLSDGLIVLSGCMSGMLAKAVTESRVEDAEALVKRFKSMFGDRYFIEVMESNSKELNSGLMALAKKFDVLPVITSDCHMARREDLWLAESMLILNTAPTRISSIDHVAAQKMNFLERLNYLYPDRQMSFAKFELFLHTYEEHRANLEKHGIGQEPIDNTMVVANMVEDYPYYDGLDLFPNPWGADADIVLRERVYAGLKKRGVNDDESMARIEYELDTISKKNLAPYFLVVSDVTDYAKDNNILTGYGRGSGVSYLTNYALGITRINPMPYNLLPERFISLDRPDPADIDTDFAVAGRYQIKKYVEREYKHVSNILTVGYYKDKSALKAAAKVLAAPFADANKAMALIGTLEEYEAAPSTREFRTKYPDVLPLARALLGRIQNYGMHAGGTVISKEPIEHFVPVQTAEDPSDKAAGRVPVAALDMTELADIGFIKMDFLGLRTLSIVDDALKMIKARHDIDIDIENIPLDDNNIYDMISAGHTTLLFQAEQSASTKTILEMGGVGNFSELVASNALVRPGAANSSVGKTYMTGKKTGHIKKMHPDIDDILKETYGACLYQETPIVTTRGVKRIADLVPGDFVYGDTGVAPVSRKVFTGEKRGYRLRFGNGRELIASSDHKFLTPTGYKTVAELDGELVAVPRYETSGVHDPNKAWLAGIALAEGCLSSGFVISNQDENILDHFEKLGTEVFGSRINRYFHCRSLYSRLLGENGKNFAWRWLREINMAGKTKGDKIIPDWVWTLNRESKASFVGAWISGDGSVGTDYCKIRTAYQRNAHDLHDLLITMGVHSRVCHDSSGWTVFVLDSNAYNSIIRPFVIGSKRNIEYRAISAMGLAPNPIPALLEQTGLSARAFFRENEGDRRLATANYLKRVTAEVYGFKSDYTYVSVSVEDTEQYYPMYDIEVEGVHSFTTNGVISHNCLYQEQQLLLCQRVAGMSAAHANKVRKAISKKIPEDLAVWKEEFITGATEKLGEAKAKRVWKDLEASADYAFAKAHAVGYSMLTLLTAYLKYYYPIEYITAALRHFNTATKTDRMKMLTCLIEAKRLGIRIRLPHVNLSDVHMEIQSDDRGDFIRFGLASVKYLSTKTAMKIISGRPYNNYAELVAKSEEKWSGISTRVLESLNAVGAAAFEDNPLTGHERDNFYTYVNIPAISYELDPFVKTQFLDLRDFEQDGTFVILGLAQESKRGATWQRIDFVDETGTAGAFIDTDAQVELGKLYAVLISNNSIMDCVPFEQFGQSDLCKHLEAKGYTDVPDGMLKVIAFRHRTTKAGRKMADVVFSDNDKNLISAKVWPSQFGMAYTLLKPGAVVDVKLKEIDKGYALDAIL